jgi:hypothetical protein
VDCPNVRAYLQKGLPLLVFVKPKNTLIMDFVVMNSGTNFKLMPVTDKAQIWAIKNRQKPYFPFTEFFKGCFHIEGKRLNEAIGNIENEGLSIMQKG